MANLSYEQLRLNIGLEQRISCTQQENQAFNEMVKNGQELPEDLIKSKYNDSNGIPFFYKVIRNSPADKETLFTLMRISKDIHFIKMLYQITFIISIILGVILVPGIFSIIF